MAKNIMGTYPTSNMGNPSEQYDEIAKLKNLKALRSARDYGATDAQVATGFKLITGNPIDAVRNKYQADPNVVKQVNQSIGFTQPATKPVTTTPSQVARTGIYMGENELKKQIGGGVITDPSHVNPLGMQYQQMQGAGEYGQATNAIGTFKGSNRVVNVDPNVAAAYNRPQVGQRTSGGGIYLGKASEQPERQSTTMAELGSRESYQDRMARWNATGGYNPRTASPKAREEQAMARENRAAQNAQANVAGEREAGVERFKAEKAAEGMVGKTKTEGEAAANAIDRKGGWDVKAAAAKYSAMAPERRSKMLDEYSKALTNAEPGSQLHTLISQELSAMGANPSAPAAIQEGATATSKDGKKIKYSGGKWIPA